MGYQPVGRPYTSHEPSLVIWVLAYTDFFTIPRYFLLPVWKWYWNNLHNVLDLVKTYNYEDTTAHRCIPKFTIILCIPKYTHTITIRPNYANRIKIDRITDSRVKFISIIHSVWSIFRFVKLDKTMLGFCQINPN